jgi:hypothetical protein
MLTEILIVLFCCVLWGLYMFIVKEQIEASEKPDEANTDANH